MNPYTSTGLDVEAYVSRSMRSAATYWHAAILGVLMSFIAPVCNAIYCDVVLDIPLSTTIMGMLRGMVPIAFVCVACGVCGSILIPNRLSRFLSRLQRVLPAVVISGLFSLYFSLLGFGYVQGYLTLGGLSVSYYVLVPALVAGLGALLQIIVRPVNAALSDVEARGG